MKQIANQITEHNWCKDMNIPLDRVSKKATKLDRDLDLDRGSQKLYEKASLQDFQGESMTNVKYGKHASNFKRPLLQQNSPMYLNYQNYGPANYSPQDMVDFLNGYNAAYFYHMYIQQMQRQLPQNQFHMQHMQHIPSSNKRNRTNSPAKT